MCGKVSSVTRKVSAQISRPSFLTRQLSVMCPATTFSPCAARPNTSHSSASNSAPEETSTSVSRQRRARLKTIVSCGEPSKLCGLDGFQLCRDAGGFVQCPVHLFSSLCCHAFRQHDCNC